MDFKRIFGTTLLAGYIALTFFLIGVLFFRSSPDLPEWAIALISAIFGGLSGKVNTITDYIFGSSQGSADKNTLINDKAKEKST